MVQVHRLYWRRSTCFLAQVDSILGAGVFFGGGETCAVNRGSVRCTGAGPHPFSSPAPKHPYTCANGWYNLNWFHHFTNQVEGEGRLRERNARIRHRRIGAKRPRRRPSPNLSSILRQRAAQKHPLEGPSKPLAVRQGPKSALGAPQPAAQRAERVLPCGCLAKRRADFSARSARSKGQGEIPGRAGNDGKKVRAKGQVASTSPAACGPLRGRRCGAGPG